MNRLSLMAHVTINGHTVECDDGITILEAARKAGIDIPALCSHPGIKSPASCRLCTVEVTARGRTRLVTACTQRVADGMELHTDTEQLRHYRVLLLELLLSRCPNVPAVREFAQHYGVTETRFESHVPEENCALCGLCVSVCQNLVGAKAIGFVKRNGRLEIGPRSDNGKPSADCIACGACAMLCPTGAITIHGYPPVDHRELTSATPRAIYVPFAQAVPNIPVIDSESCIHAKTGKCGLCDQVCDRDAIQHDQCEETIELDVGAIIVATGFELFDPREMPQYGYGRLPNVITALEFETMSNAGGPTHGEILLTDGSSPQSVAIIHCVGSRDENHNEYCSSVCCMYSLKCAHLVREKVPDAGIYELYIDMRATGKGYEEFYKRVLSEDVTFIRGKAAEVTDVAEQPDEDGKLIVKCEDTLIGEIRRLPVDMVVLSPALKPRADAPELARILGLSCTDGGFFLEKHPKLAPVATSNDGVFIAGACQGPKDIPASVAQAAAAAMEATALIDAGSVTLEPIIAHIDEETCGGCKTCMNSCPYDAIQFDEEKAVCVVQEVLCKGCGTCVASCPAGAASQEGFEDMQLAAEIEAVLDS